MTDFGIPVIIDSIKKLDEFQRTRCIYYRLEFTNGELIEDPFFYWNTPEGLIFGWGDWAVLAGPNQHIENTSLWLSPESINKTFSNIENSEWLLLELGHIWLPNELLNLDSLNSHVKAGDVYRLPSKLFHLCYSYSADILTDKHWHELCLGFSEEINRSKEETIAFRHWRANQIAIDRERYHSPEYAQFRLPTKGEDDHTDDYREKVKI